MFDRILCMGRRLRIHFAGALYHVIAHGVNKQDVFLEDQDRQRFMMLFVRFCDQAWAQRIAYCLMNNHFHLLLRVREASLSSIMHRLLTRYSAWFNDRHERKGHLFQARYEPRICLDERYLTSLVRYVHENPVHHGFVDHPAQWAWSSYHEYLAGGKDPMAESSAGLAAINDEFEIGPGPANKAASGASLLRLEAIQPTSLLDCAAKAAGEAGISLAELRSRSKRGPVSGAKRGFARMAIGFGFRATQIAKFLNISLPAVSRTLRGC